MYNHHKALMTYAGKDEKKMRKEIKKNEPHPHVDAVYRKNPKPPLRFKYLEEYANVYKTYKACDKEVVKAKVKYFRYF